MDKKKETAEIKRVLMSACKRCRTFEEDYMQDRYAESLVRAKYRKADVVEKEIAKKIFQELFDYYNGNNGEGFVDFQAQEDLKTFAEKYGVEIG